MYNIYLSIIRYGLYQLKLISMQTLQQTNVKRLFMASMALSLAGLIGVAIPALAAGTDTMTMTTPTTQTMNGAKTYHIMVMTHLCNSSIKNADDFQNMESGKNPILAIAGDVLTCPTTGLAANAAATGTVASPRSMYNFTVSTNAQTMSLASGTFMQHKLCESDINADVNADGMVSTSTCLDISHYDVPVMSSSASSTIVHVMETQAPTGYHLGVLRFSPVALDGNNDSEALTYFDAHDGHIDLNMVADKDGMIMLHVYNFQNSGADMGTGTSTVSTTTPSTGTGTGVINTPTQVRAGTTIDLNGHKFGKEEHVMVMSGGVLVGNAFTNSTGDFSTGSVTVPNMPGMYIYSFTGQSSGISGQTTVTVVQ
jgi:hypothetical protein